MMTFPGKWPAVTRFLLSLALVACWASFAQAAVIEVDTVWSGRVEIDGEVTVGPEATLLVRPGTEVRFGGGDGAPAALKILGQLVAQGTKEAPILFTSTASNPTPGDWLGVVFDHSRDRTSRLRHCTIEYARSALGGSRGTLIVEECRLQRNAVGLDVRKQLAGGLWGCEILENGTGVRFNQSALLSLANCRIAQNQRHGIDCNFQSAPHISNCLIEGSGQAGVFCFQGSSPLISDCLIRGNRRGIHAELKSHPEIVHNEIDGNEVGLWADKLVAPLAVGNRITANGVGIYCNHSGYPQLRGNLIEGNRRFAVVLGDQQSWQVDRLLPAASRRKELREAPDLPPERGERAKERIEDEAQGPMIVDVRENWWGEEGAREMVDVGPEVNLSLFEDAFDKPEVAYQGRTYPRDRVVFSPPLSQLPDEAGRRAKEPSGIRGKVVFAGEPLVGARVHVFRQAGEDLGGEGYSYSAPTDSEGRFTLHLAPGRYLLVVKKTETGFPAQAPAPGDLYAYYGGNPVAVEAGIYTGINLQAVRYQPQEVNEAAEEGATLLEGVMRGPEGTLSGVMLYLYPDASSAFRGPDLFGPRGALPAGTDESGRFVVEVPPGSYYLVAARRSSGGLGPLQVGDWFGYFPGNPLAIGEGEQVEVALELVEKLRPGVEKAPGEGALLGVSGVIRDKAGLAHSGLYAFAFTDPYPVGNIPPFRSRPNGENGEFFLPLSEPGVYYLGARSGYGGPPVPGQWHSFHGDAQLVRVEVGPEGATGSVSLVVEEME